ncbi:MAG: hypothetical protein NXI15_08910 [Gammaproteobacteria bacterium]|nr:hypothetical protein [Gammaproteobacteria bacterium]
MSELNKNRMVLLLIAGIPLTMILAASWLWYFVAKGELDLVGALGTANQGTLVQPPRQLDDYALFEGDLPSSIAELEPKWTLLVPTQDVNCDVQCERSLYMTRQIHVAIGKDFKRIRRIFVSVSDVDAMTLDVPELSDGHPAPPNFAAYLANEHRGLRAWRTDEDGFSSLFVELEADPTIWYLVDPRGWVMMSYNADIPYKDVISDLKFLLKNSSN